ncbi:Hint domain-containing protein [Paracoccus tegillarcae]|uniref:Hedgehog/Intein (Hint) domain-containing protein n=1 Tax=Paracoccus tegillarcae TaxID=1529068 RepID=A0A2K9EH95_9RHOB|nr:Hint domain-containing protein [Paracoccus tegillarcae]AUH34330.1 hypothetical protein CUV01_13890 [Paracoccus tegillarcae]
MPTFTGLYLGTLYASGPFDPTEGNTTVENPDRFEDRTFGSSSNPLYEMSTGVADAGAVNITLGSADPGGDGLLTQNNAGSVYDEFQVNGASGGYRAAFDMGIRYDATITYADGSTATVQVWLVQAETTAVNSAAGSAGQVYVFPDTSAGANADALSAKPIASIALGSHIPGSEVSAGLAKSSILATDFSYDGVVNGTSGSDLIDGNYHEALGSGGADQVDGGDAVVGQFGNNDSIRGLGGNDTIFAGEGRDTVSGGTGADQIHGGAENDVITGDAGTDTIYGDGGDDTINAGSENDVVFGNEGNDSILGGAGNDNLSGDGVSDPNYHTYTGYVFGNNFQDSGSVAATNYDGMQITGAATTITIRDDDNTLLSDYLNEEQFVDANQVVLINGVEHKAFLEQIVTMEDPATGEQYVFAQLDVDINNNDAAGAGEQGNVNILLSDNAPPPGATLVSVSGTAVNDQNLVYPPSSSDDTILGEAGNDTIHGQAGDDSLDGGADSDSIEGNDGDDTLLGGITGDDTLLGGSGEDSIIGGVGSDSIDGGANNDIIDAGTGADQVFGGSGDDTITAGDGNDLVYGDSNIPGSPQGYEYKAYYLGQNFADLLPGQVAHYLNGINITGTPITVTINDNDLELLTDDNSANGGVNDSFSDLDQTVTINGITYNVLLEQLVTYQDQFGNTYRFAQLDIDYNNDGIANNSLSPEQGSLQLLLSDTPPPIGADLTLVPGSIDGSNDLLYDDNWDDSILGGAGEDTIYGEKGNDTIDGGADNDTISGGDGNDLIFGGAGNDSLMGDLGNDTINAQDGNDTVLGGAGDDSIQAGSGDDSLMGEAGNDTIDGDVGMDTIEGGAGSDTLLGGADADYIDGGADADDIAGGTGNDTILGGTGADIIDGGADNDSIDGGAGDDSLDGGDGVDNISGGTGSDAITAGRGDTATGGDDRDTFTLDVNQVGSGSVFTVDGGAGVGTTADYDSIVLGPGLTYAGNWSGVRDADDNSWSGSFDVVDDASNTYTVNFTEIEGPICFARGTEIQTETGVRKVEHLREGDMLMTRDNGPKPISWIGSRGFVNDQSENARKFSPILIRKGALGSDRPNRDLFVSPQHRILVRSKIAQRMFGEDEVLIAAILLLQIDGIEQVSDFDEVEYFHILFDQHEIVYANGVEAESLHTGPEALKSLPLEARQEIFAIFPQLAEMTGGSSRSLARFSPKGKKARKLAERQQMKRMPLQ